MSRTETVERGHTIRVMPSKEQQNLYRILTYVGVALGACGLLGYLHVNNQSELEAAARRGDVATVQQCASGWPLVDKRAALRAAIEDGKGNVVRYLVTKQGVPAVDGLDTAARNGRGDILRALLENGATVRGAKGGKLLWRAAHSGDTETVYLLLHYGADKNLPNTMDDNYTPLMYAADSGKPGVVKALVDARADVRARSKTGRTALTIAAATNDPQAVKYLLDAGAEINGRDNKGRTALTAAAVVGNYTTLDYLLSRGASTKVKDKSGKTALDHAIQVGDAGSANRLRRARGQQQLAKR